VKHVEEVLHSSSSVARVPEQVRRGRLRDPSTSPDEGEEVTEILALGGAVIEQILSGSLPAPLDYRQELDEWVVVLCGGATLTVDDESVELTSGEWLFLPAGLRHRLVRTQPGTSWLAVHLPRREPSV
jgi:cupin 2 domain-containing protein